MANQLVLKEDLEVLTRVLKVTLTEAPTTASPASARGTASDTPLPLTDLAEELVAEAGDETSAEAVAARFADIGSRRSLFDRALVGRLSATTDTPVVDFLVASFSRCADLKSRKGTAASAELTELFQYVAELCVSYSAIALQNPTMFPQPADAEAEGVLRLLRPLREDALPASFLTLLVNRLVEEGALPEVVLPMFAKLAEEASKVKITSADYGPYRALHTLVREKAIGALFANDPSFLPLMCRNGSLLQACARMGPFFGLSCFPAEVAMATQCFPDVSNPMACEQTMSSLRAGTSLVQRALTSICKEMLKNADSKEPLFRFIAASCALNGARSQQWFPHAEGQRILHEIAPNQIEPPQQLRTYSHDGMLLNLGATLLQLCDPFTAPNSPHAAKIDPSYILSTHRLNLKEETRLCATADDVMYWLDSRNPDLRQRYLDRMAAEGLVNPDSADEPPLEVSATFGTISEYFFLTGRVLHVGLLSSFTMLHHLMKENQRWTGDLQLREQIALTGGANPQVNAEIAEMRKWTEKLKQCILCFQTQVANPDLVSMCVRYYRLVSRWLVATANPPAEGLPLPEQVPRIFAALPEYLMQDVAEFLKFITEVTPQSFEAISAEELNDFVTMMVTFIGAPKYVKNPYLRATFTKLLCYLVPKHDDEMGRRHASERLASVFHTHPLAQRALAPSVMQFFVDVEFSGSHTGHFDKYTYRSEMALVLEYLWQQPVYKATMIAYARDTSKFVRFVNMLINDSIHAMNESLTKLKSIKDMQAEMADEATWNAQPQRQRQQREQTLRQDEGHANYFMIFTADVLGMVKYLSTEKEVALVFMLPELAPRISAMLNHFLVELVGPRCSTLKVREPEKYHFNPKGLLHEIVSIILHFAPFPEFGHAMIKDERSFDPGNLRKAVRVLGRSTTDLSVRPEHLQALEAFASRCVELKEEAGLEEEDLGEIPDEYLDPVTAELMEDPVKLPSGHSMDRATITRHLLSDETDPFSRARCTVDMLVDNEPLKSEIANWKAQRKAEAAAARAAGAAPMEEG